MPLYALLIEHEGKSFSTQVEGASAQAAIQSFFSHPIAKSMSPVLGPQDIIYITPMTDLVNMWAVCAGKVGRYVSVTVVKTAGQQEA